MTIEKGDQIVTQNGDVAEVDVIYSDHRKSVFCEGVVKAKKEDVVKVSEPIRVKVDSEREAKHLVEMAEDAGFEYIDDGIVERVEPLELLISPVYKNIVKFRKEGQCISKNNQDLTYPSDSDMVLGYLSYHAESEDDECETCGGRDYIYTDRYNDTAPCPDCTDSDDDYDESRSEDESGEVIELAKYIHNQYKRLVRRYCWKTQDGTSVKFEELPEDNKKVMLGLSRKLYEDYIDDLESELDDCWENQQEYKNDVAELQEKLEDVKAERDHWQNEWKLLKDVNSDLINKRDDLQNRIEEARDELMKKAESSGQIRFSDDPLYKAIRILSNEGGEG